MSGAISSLANQGVGALGLGDISGMFGKGPAGQISPEAFQMPAEAGGIYQDVLRNYKNLFQNYQGGASSPYVQSMINPVIASNARTLGDVTQQQGLRGIRGSSFGEASLGNLASEANRNVADITAQAQRQQLMDQLGLLGGMTDIGGRYQGWGGTALSGRLSQAEQELLAQKQNAGLFGGLMGGISQFIGAGGGGALPGGAAAAA